MKKSVLLILLFCWNHVCGHWLHCSTGVVITNQAISLPSSTHAGAKVFLLRKYQARSLIDCLEECCSGKNRLCSVVEYKNNSADVNCVYYSCQPIRKCKFMDSEGTDTFTFPYTSQNLSSTYNAIHNDSEDYNKLKSKVFNESSSIHHSQQRTFKDHARAVAARKGVEPFTPVANNKEVYTTPLENGSSSKSTYAFKDHTGTVTARKGVESDSSVTNEGSSVSWKGFSATYLENGDSLKSSDTVTIEDILSKTDTSFKNDNTTIKPRKGVDSEVEPVFAKIKPRKGVEVLHSSESTNNPEISRSKVKPRKGVVSLPFPLTAAPVMNKTASSETVSELSSVNIAPITNIKNFSQTLPSHLDLSTDLISLLEQVFREESPSPASYVTRTVGISASSSFTISSSSVSSVKYNEYSTLPLNSAITDRSSISGITDSPFMPFHTVLPSPSSGYHEKVLESTPPLAVVSEHVKHQPVSPTHVSGQILNPSHSLPALQTSLRAENTISNDESLNHHDNAVLLFTVSSPNKTKVSVLSTTGDSESERKYKSSMHLVLSLVFGLVVLFVVFGAVAKRVYDVWMRRHYHRMDFLIDGMYDGFS